MKGNSASDACVVVLVRSEKISDSFVFLHCRWKIKMDLLEFPSVVITFFLLLKTSDWSDLIISSWRKERKTLHAIQTSSVLIRKERTEVVCRLKQMPILQSSSSSCQEKEKISSGNERCFPIRRRRTMFSLMSQWEFITLWLLTIYYGNSSHSNIAISISEKREQERNERSSLPSLITWFKMTTTIKTSFLIDDLLSTFKRPTSSTVAPPPTAPPPAPTPAQPVNQDLPSTNLSLNFFQPPNQFNQYAAIKPELHPFFFHGKETTRGASAVACRLSRQCCRWGD